MSISASDTPIAQRLTAPGFFKKRNPKEPKRGSRIRQVRMGKYASIIILPEPNKIKKRQGKKHQSKKHQSKKHWSKQHHPGQLILQSAALKPG